MNSALVIEQRTVVQSVQWDSLQAHATAQSAQSACAYTSFAHASASYSELAVACQATLRWLVEQQIERATTEASERAQLLARLDALESLVSSNPDREEFDQIATQVGKNNTKILQQDERQDGMDESLNVHSKEVCVGWRRN